MFSSPYSLSFEHTLSSSAPMDLSDSEDDVDIPFFNHSAQPLWGAAPQPIIDAASMETLKRNAVFALSGRGLASTESEPTAMEIEEDNSATLSKEDLQKRMNELGLNYKIDSQIGSGATSTIYRVISKDAVFALKVWNSKVNIKDQLREEAYLKKVFNSPHCVRLLRSIKINDSTNAILMPYYPLSMHEKMQKGFLKWDDIRYFSIQLLHGLDHLEKLKIVHLDLSPRNILLSNEGRALIGDFGQSVTVSELSKIEWPMQTLAYSHPKFHLLGVYPEHGLDLWSLGCILVEMITGLPPVVCSENETFPSLELARLKKTRETLGAFPTSWVEKSKLYQNHLLYLESTPAGNSQTYLSKIVANRFKDAEKSHCEKLVDFLKKLLTYDSQLTAHEMLSHPYVTKL